MHGMRCRPKLIMVAAVLFACSRPSVIPTPEPVPTFPPTQPQPSPPRTTKSEWHLSADPSAHSYKSTTRSTIRSTDQPAGREISTQSETWFTISTNSLRKPVLVSGSVDSIRSTSAQDTTRFPAGFTGSFSTGELALKPVSQNVENQCLSRFESILGEIRPIISTLPIDLRAGDTWSDSLETRICSGDRIPTTAHITRQYTLQGSSEIAGRQALAINRSEKTRLDGEGTQGQHQIRVRGEGTTTAALLIDAMSGALLRMEGDQQLRIEIQASGRTQNFTQSTRQTVDLIR